MSNENMYDRCHFCDIDNSDLIGRRTFISTVWLADSCQVVVGNVGRISKARLVSSLVNSSFFNTFWRSLSCNL